MEKQVEADLEESVIEVLEDWERDPRKAGKIILGLTDLLFRNMNMHQDEIKSLRDMNKDAEDSEEYNNSLGKIHAYRTVYNYILRLTKLDHPRLVELLNTYKK